jgi:RND family efflux transporter MFP subunit
LDAVSRTKKVVLELDAADPRVNAGMFARIKLNTTRYEDVIMVPASAVIEKQGKTGVYIKDDANTVAFREVTSGVVIDNVLQITAGLSGGETVVTQGQQYLSDGAKVNVL